MGQPADLVTAADAARIIGIARRRVVELGTADPEFPPSQPLAGGGRAWSRAAVLEWAAAHPDLGRVFTGPQVPPSHGWPPHVAQVMRLASKEANALHHTWVGLDHLVLGMLRPDCPGAARVVLESFGLRLESLRQAFVDSMGDPYDAKPTHAEVEPATLIVLERANLEAARLADVEVTSEHVLLALASRWDERLATRWLARHGVTPNVLRRRVVDATEGVALPTPAPLAAPLPEYDPAAGLDLAPNPRGHDPRRRGPWSQMPFPVRPVAEGQPLQPGMVARGYFRDRDGYPVLTTDGRPVFFVLDEQAMPVRDAQGRMVLGPVEVPPGCQVTARHEKG
jgi:predicted DNA-binding transcriptional regulator AlpA